jgi:hypothetical protein
VNPLARIVYNMVAEGAEAGAKASGDDMLRAAGKIADEGVEAADDWGWKGGKPGEVTGNKFMPVYAKAFEDASIEDARMAEEIGGPIDTWFESAKKILDKRLNPMLNRVYKQVDRSNNPYFKNSDFTANDYYISDDDLINLMADFKLLEDADIPREWTGKVLPAIRSRSQQAYGNISPVFAKQVSDAMRPLTNDQREEFLALLPEWTESLEDLSNAVKML